MLTVYDSQSRGTRRELLSIGGLALGGLSLVHPLAAQNPRAARSRSHPLLRGKSVIFLFQQGGPSQLETFDPKPDAPRGIRTVGECIDTAIPGLRFGETLPRLATLANRLAIVQSYQTENTGHNIRPLVGPETRNTGLGAYLARVAGTTHPITAMPTSAVVLPQSVCSDVAPGQGRGDLLATGTLGGAYAPFVPGGSSQLLQNLRLNMTLDRLQDRRALRAEFDRLNHKFSSESQFELLDRQQQQACEVLLSGSVADALDLAQEPPQTLARYDTSRFAGGDRWNIAQRGKRGYYSGHAKSLGKALLLARRLCEAGCGFITVHCGYEGVWDMHADSNNLNMADGMQAVAPAFDHAVAAFIQDVTERGLADQILLVATGEMGRTPRINKHGGRDHWGKLAPLMLFGGGAPSGVVIGRSTRDGGEPVSDPITSARLISTLLHAVFDIPQLRLEPSLSFLSQLAEPEPITGY